MTCCAVRVVTENVNTTHDDSDCEINKIFGTNDKISSSDHSNCSNLLPLAAATQRHSVIMSA
jgi:hypothetical protein